MPLRLRLLIIGCVIAAPLLAAAIGLGQTAGLLVGIALVGGGVAWMVLGDRAE